MSPFPYIFLIVLYSMGLFMFGGYIKFIEIVDLFNCFACKELNELELIYDYIVVGYGSAGSVVALRLAEDKHTTVLALEAGPHGARLFDIPAIGPLLQLSSIDWWHRTVPQEKAAWALRNQVSNWPMGRIVGGTGRLNNMVYLRGHPSDFHDWFKDDPAFNYEIDILSYFKKAEDHRGSYENDTVYHSRSGPLVVEDLQFVSPLAQAVLEAAENLGYPVRDLNGKYNTGFMQSQANTESGVRWTPAHLFYKYNKPNLILQTNTLVHRVLFKENYEAYAVKYSYLGQALTVRARKGIILSAGVIGTPKLLMRSGIGPKEHLEDKGIENIIDLPVGNNLQDHVTTGVDLVLLNTSLGINLPSLLSPFSMFDYFLNSSGPWTSVGCEVVAVIDTESRTYCYDYLNEAKLASISRIKQYRDKMNYKMKKKAKTKTSSTYKRGNILDKYLPAAQRYKSPKIVTDIKYDITNEVCPLDDGRQPDLQFMVIPLGASTDGGSHIKDAFGLSDNIWDHYFSRLFGKTAISILPIVLHPKSRGTVRLSNKNVYSKPVINPNYLSDPYDVDILLKGIELIKRIIETKPMQKLGARLNEQRLPGCEHIIFDTQPYWECYVRHITLTSYHPGGTCKMGGVGDKDAVVSYDFQVRGTNKLYVVDASVMPTLPSGNSNAAVVMLGEKAADEIKYHNYLSKEKQQECIAIKVETSDMKMENDLDHTNPQLEWMLTDELIIKDEAVASKTNKISEDDPLVKDEEEILSDLDFTTCQEKQESTTIKTETSDTEMESDLDNPLLESLLTSELIIKDEGVSCNTNAISDRLIECQICNKTIGKNYFKLHMLVHSEDKKFHCEICDYKTAWKSCLRTHIMNHTGEKPYGCKICEYKTAIKSSLKLHMLAHTKEKPYGCKICDYKTGIKDSLKKHMVTHTKEKPYECKLCDYKTANKRTLKMHMLTHTKEKPYGCKICDFKTAVNNRLKQHMLTHTEEKPYGCKLCNFKTKWNACLTTHMLTHIKEF